MKIVNVSGEPREYIKDGFVYIFPFPADKPTEVPKEIAESLLETKQYKEYAVETKKKIEKIDDKNIENGTI
jgi:hypothetical protein